jgi:hypothetical protein
VVNTQLAQRIKTSLKRTACLRSHTTQEPLHRVFPCRCQHRPMARPVALPRQVLPIPDNQAVGPTTYAATDPDTANPPSANSGPPAVRPTCR